jgi:Coenzyme PQQ synthesis protein D (PqqD)
MITLQSLCMRKDDGFLVSELGEDIVMMNMKTGNYLGLNSVSVDIWKLLDQPITAGAIIDNLTTKYEIDRESCETQTLECLNKMALYGMIQLN